MFQPPQTSEQVQAQQPAPIQYELYENSEPKQRKITFLSKIKFIIPAILILGTIALVTVILNNYRTLLLPTPQATPAPTLVPASPDPTPEPIQTSIYHNLDLKFSFNYPKDKNILECNNTVYIYTDITNSDTGQTCDQKEKILGVQVSHAQTSYYPQYVLPDDEQEPLDESASVLEEVLLVGDQTAIKQVVRTPDQYLNSITFNKDNNFYLIKINNEADLPIYESIYQSFIFTKDLYEDWQTYQNQFYNLKYPPEWSLIEPESALGTLKLSKYPDYRELNTFSLDFATNQENASISASEVISSVKNLSGWESTPSLNIKNLKKGTALILDGKFQGNWHTFIAIYHRNYLVQIDWYDEASRSHEELFENMLASFEFAN